MTTTRSLLGSRALSALGYGMVVAALALAVLSGCLQRHAPVAQPPAPVVVAPPPPPPPAVEPAPAPQKKVTKPKPRKPVRRKPRRVCDENGWCWTSFAARE